MKTPLISRSTTLLIHLLIHAFAHCLMGQTRSSTQTQINNLLPTNGSRQINASILRSAFNATLNYTDTKTGARKAPKATAAKVLPPRFISPTLPPTWTKYTSTSMVVLPPPAPMDSLW
jgi:hypothetical protein